MHIRLSHIIQFEEYISAALSSVKYRDFIAKGEGNGVLITGGAGLLTPWQGDSLNTQYISLQAVTPVLRKISIPYGFLNSRRPMLMRYGIGLQIH